MINITNYYRTEKKNTQKEISPSHLSEWLSKKKKSLSNKFWQVCGEKERKFFLIGM